MTLRPRPALRAAPAGNKTYSCAPAHGLSRPDDGRDDSNGGYLALTWEDGKTRLCLRVPYDERAPDFVAEEVVLPDCPADQPQGAKLPPLAFCGRGVEHCELGATRAAVTGRWKLPSPPPTTGGAVILGQPDSSPYELVLVWFEGDKASRIVAPHRAQVSADPAGMAAALQRAWSVGIDRLGYLRRQDGPHRPTLSGYGWHDDRTRVRIFVQETEKGPRLFTEWREWPVAAVRGKQ